jgi:hypothetical protein
VTDLPGWTGSAAVSNVFVVPNVPTPECSLDGGALPGTAPCNDASYALHDAGVDSLVNEMESQGDYFYRTAAHPTGIVGANDVVVIKINNQWAGNGDGSGAGRLCTNSDALKGLIWRILSHPDSFSGEVVVAENTQGVVWDWDITPANAQDQNQTYQDVVNAFQGLGYAVSLSAEAAIRQVNMPTATTTTPTSCWKTPKGAGATSSLIPSSRAPAATRSACATAFGTAAATRPTG